MKALVTGANGFTGSHLVKALLDRGHTVTAFVRKSSQIDRIANLSIEFAYGDICDRSALETAMQGIDWVFHTAAYVELGLVDAAKMERTNVDGTAAVLAAATAAKVAKVVYCSTIGVYGDTQGETIDETFERRQQDFSSAYDRTKFQAQQLVNQAVAQGLPVVSIMPSGIFGADDPHFGPVMAQFCKGGLKVWAGGDRITGIVHVDDLAQLMILAAEKAPAGAHYIASTDDMTTREMFDFLSQETGIAAPREIPEPIVRSIGNLLDPIGRFLSWQPPISRERVHYLYDRCVRVDGSKARRELGWQPRSIEATLRESLPKAIGKI